MMIHHFFYIFVGMIAILAIKQIPLKKHWHAWRVESQVHKSPVIDCLWNLVLRIWENFTTSTVPEVVEIVL
jgi:hypothetical protein